MDKKGKSADEIAEITGGDPEPIQEAFDAVRIIRDKETE